MKVFFPAVISLIVLVFDATVSFSALIEGRVYLDANQNGRWDEGETGVPGVLVSDGLRVVATDASGRYRLDNDEACALLWITVPRDHRPTASFWRWADGGHSEDFGLARHPQSDNFCFIQITDTHIGNAEALRQFARQTNKLPIPIAFVVNTGDMVRDSMGEDLKEARKLFERYIEAASAFEPPQFNVPGNHDHAGIGVKTVNKNDPLWGKGLYRHLFGPMHYSWDWGNVHFVALDGTRFPPYAEKLGTEQLAWLKADLSFQPHDKPLVLFCHQSVAVTKNVSGGLEDTQELAGALQGRNVLGLICGHLHLTFTSQLGEFPVYQTGAFCGGGDHDEWVWAGPCSDGSPQGFRLVQIKNGQLKTAYSNREGHYPLYVSSPVAPLKSHSAQSGKMEIEVVAMDFGKPVEVTAQYADQPVPLKMVSREELWSTWKGTVDTSLADDGEQVVRASSRLGDDVSTCDVHYLVLNGRRTQPYQADAPARLTFQVYKVQGAAEILFNDKPLGTVAANTPDKTVLTFDIPSDRLAKVNRVTVGEGGPFSLKYIKMEYKEHFVSDLRYYRVSGHSFRKATSSPPRPERDALYFCLP